MHYKAYVLINNANTQLCLTLLRCINYSNSQFQSAYVLFVTSNYVYYTAMKRVIVL